MSRSSRRRNCWEIFLPLLTACRTRAWSASWSQSLVCDSQRDKAKGIIDPTKIDPVAQKYIQEWAANGLTVSTPTGLYSTSVPYDDNRNELTGKFDFNLNSKDKISATLGLNKTYNYNSLDASTVAVIPVSAGELLLSQSGVHPDLLAHAAQRISFRGAPQQLHLGCRGQGFHVQRLGSWHQRHSRHHHGTDQHLLRYRFLHWSSENGPTRYLENTFSWTEALSWTKGKNNWKFGAGFSPYQQNLSYGYYLDGELDYYSGVGDDNGSGNDYADFLLGATDAYFQNANAPSTIRSKSTYVFGQDEWHLSKNLVLTLGLRYEYNTPKADTQGEPSQ